MIGGLPAARVPDSGCRSLAELGRAVRAIWWGTWLICLKIGTEERYGQITRLGCLWPADIRIATYLFGGKGIGGGMWRGLDGGVKGHLGVANADYRGVVDAEAHTGKRGLFGLY